MLLFRRIDGKLASSYEHNERIRSCDVDFYHHIPNCNSPITLRRVVYKGMAMITFSSETEDRTALVHYINSLGLTGYGVEVGVHIGFYSDIILKESNLKHLVSVDIWEIEKNFLRARRRLEPHGSRSSMLKCESVVAASFFPNSFFDFIYIDADHRYKGVKDDLEAWWPKLRNGGVFAGHDYEAGVKKPDGRFIPFGVIQAVDEFVERIGHQINLTTALYKSWYFVKHMPDVKCL